MGRAEQGVLEEEVEDVGTAKGMSSTDPWAVFI